MRCFKYKKVEFIKYETQRSFKKDVAPGIHWAFNDDYS